MYAGIALYYRFYNIPPNRTPFSNLLFLYGLYLSSCLVLVSRIGYFTPLFRSVIRCSVLVFPILSVP